MIDGSNHAWKSVNNRFDIYKIFKYCKSNRKQYPNGLYGIARSLNCTSKTKRKSRALFSSVDSPSQGKRFFVQLICVVLRKCRQWWPGCCRLGAVSLQFSSVLFNRNLELSLRFAFIFFSHKLVEFDFEGKFVFIGHVKFSHLFYLIKL